MAVLWRCPRRAKVGSEPKAAKTKKRLVPASAKKQLFATVCDTVTQPYRPTILMEGGPRTALRKGATGSFCPSQLLLGMFSISTLATQLQQQSRPTLYRQSSQTSDALLSYCKHLWWTQRDMNFNRAIVQDLFRGLCPSLLGPYHR